MDFIIVPLLIFIGFYKAKNHQFNSTLLSRISIPLYLYHILFSVLFYTYINIKGGDAFLYWEIPKNIQLSLLINKLQVKLHATEVLYLINFLPSNIFNLSFFTGNILYGTIGYFGHLYLLKSIDQMFPYIDGLKKYKVVGLNVFPWIFFLPNFHFWSSGVGKDTLSFFCISLFIYGILKPINRWFYLFISILITYFIRPHITLFLVSAFGAPLLLKSNIPKNQKIILFSIALVGFIPLLNYVLAFVNIDNLTTESFNNFSESKANSLSRTANTGIDISSLPYPLKVLTFLYRPFFFDARNFLGLLSSFENLIWFLLSFKFFVNKPIKVLKKSNFVVLGSFLYWLIGAIAFAPVMSNLGIIVRERNMILPAFLIFIIGSFSKNKLYYKYSIYKSNYLD